MYVSCKYLTVIIMATERKKVKSLSPVQLFATPSTVVYQASPSMGFFRQEYWSGLPFPSPGDLPDPGIEPRSPASSADALPSEPGNQSFLCSWPCDDITRRQLSANQKEDPDHNLPRCHPGPRLPSLQNCQK